MPQQDLWSIYINKIQYWYFCERRQSVQGRGSALHCWWGCAKRHRARKLQCSPGRVEWPIQRQTTLKIYYVQQLTTNDGMIHMESVFWGWMWIEALRWTLPYILDAVCSTQHLNRYEQMIQFHTFPFEKTSSHPSAVLKSLFSNKDSTLWV